MSQSSHHLKLISWTRQQVHWPQLCNCVMLLCHYEPKSLRNVSSALFRLCCEELRQIKYFKFSAVLRLSRSIQHICQTSALVWDHEFVFLGAFQFQDPFTFFKIKPCFFFLSVYLSLFFHPGINFGFHYGFLQSHPSKGDWMTKALDYNQKLHEGFFVHNIIIYFPFVFPSSPSHIFVRKNGKQ